MGFFDALAANPSGSGVYGATGAQKPDLGAAMSIDEEMRRRNLNDHIKQANFDASLSMRQNRINQVYGTNPMVSPQGSPGGQPNVVFNDTHPDITPIQHEELGVQHERVADEKRRQDIIENQAQQRIDVGKGELDLNKKKNQQIYDTKQADLERKVEEANQREQLARDQMKGRESDAQRVAAHRDAALAATTAQHNLENARKDTQMQKMSDLHEAQMKAMQDRLDQAGNTETETTQNPEGTKRTTNVKKGSKKSGDSLGIR